MRHLISTRLVATTPGGGERRVLDAARDIFVSMSKNDSSELRFEIPHLSELGGGEPWGGRAHDLLGRYDVAFEVNFTATPDDPGEWVEPRNARFVIVNSATAGGADGSRVYECVNAPAFDLSAGPNLITNRRDPESGRSEYDDMEPGRVLRHFIEGGKRNPDAMKYLTYDFTDTHDSLGQPWAKRVDVEFSADATAADALEAIGNAVDWWTEGNMLRVSNPGAMGRDLWHEMAFGREFEDMPERVTALGVADAVYGVATIKNAAGKDVHAQWTINAPSSIRQRSTRGRRVATRQFPGANNLKALQAQVGGEAARQSAPLEEVSRKLADTADAFRIPFRTYEIGDRFPVQQGDGAFEEMTFTGLTYTSADDERGDEWVLYFGDHIPDTMQKVVSAQKSQGSKSAGAPGAVLPVQTGIGVPVAPPTLSAVSSLHVSRVGETTVTLSVLWDAPEETVRGVTPAAVTEYRLEGRLVRLLGEGTGGWESWGSAIDVNTREVPGLLAGREYELRVAARNFEGWGDWRTVTVLTDADTTPPPTPSAPVGESSAGMILWTWDGETAEGDGQPDDFSHAILAWAGVRDGQLVSGVLRMRLGDTLTTGPFDRGTTASATLTSVDVAGNESAPGAATDVPVVSVLDGTGLDEELQRARDAVDALEAELAAHGTTLDTELGALQDTLADLDTALSDGLDGLDGDLDALDTLLSADIAALSTALDGIDLGELSGDLLALQGMLDGLSGELDSLESDLSGRITAAQAAADQAAQDAIDKAAAAEQAAKAYAEAEAAAAQAAAVAAASTDASDKAAAAQAAAEAAAALDAKQQADAAQAAAEAKAQAAQDAADTAQAAALGAQSRADAAHGLATTADGRITVATANPTASNATGKPIGAIWEVRSGGAALRRYVLTGATTWTQVKIGQDFIGSNAIGSAQIIDLAVGSAQIADLAVTNAKIGNLSAEKINAGTLNAARIGSRSIGADKIVANSLTAGEIATNAITADELAANSVQAGHITSNAVTTVKLNANAVTAEKVSTDAIIARHVKAGEVQADHLSTNSVTADKIATNAVTAVKIAANAVTTAKLNAGAVTAVKIDSNAVTTAKLAAGAVTTEKMTAGSIDADRINAGTFRGTEIRGATLISDLPGDPDNNVTIANQTVTINRSVGDDESVATMTMGGSSADRIQLTNSSGASRVFIDGDTGDASFHGEVSAGTLVQGGDTLEDILRPLPRGVLARYGRTTSTAKAGSAEMGIARLDFETEPGRRVGIGLSTLGWLGGDAMRVRLRYRFGTTHANATVSDSQALLRDYHSGSTHWAPIEFFLPLWFETSMHMSILLTISNQDGNRPVHLEPRGTYPLQFWAEDMGAFGDEAFGVATLGGGSAYETAPAEPNPTQRYTKTYNAHSVRSWRGSTQVTDVLHHGYYGGHQRYSQILFPSTVRTDLAGATINKVEVYLKNEHTWAGSGMTARIRPTTNTSLAGSPTTSAGQSFSWARGAGQWVTITGWTATAQSIFLGGGAGTGSAGYGKFSNALSNCRLRVTYTK